MRYGLLVALMGFMALPTAWATDGNALPHPASAPVSAQVSVSRARQRLLQHQLEVKQLEQDVARQESDSQRASEHLQQQDQAIAELRKQLDALQAKAPAGQH